MPEGHANVADKIVGKTQKVNFALSSRFACLISCAGDWKVH